MKDGDWSLVLGHWDFELQKTNQTERDSRG
jgi:hypothetical protein